MGSLQSTQTLLTIISETMLLMILCYHLNACDAIEVKFCLAAKESHSARRGDKIILYQGGFSPGRGIEDLVDAAQYGSPHWHFVFMGEGQLLPIVRSINKELVVATKYIFCQAFRERTLKFGAPVQISE